MDTKQLITGNPKEGFYPIVQDTVTVIELNEAVMNLTSESSSEDIAAAFDSAESFNDLIEQIRNTENIVNGILMNNDGSVGKIICTIAAYKNQYACDIEYIYDSKIIRLDITNTDGTMSCIRKETALGGDSILETDGDGSKFLSNDGTYKAIEAGDKTNVLILSLEDDLANGQKDSPINAEVSTALKDAISTGKACVIKSANSDILANLQQIGDNVTIVMEQISRVGQTFVAVNTSITVNTATNVISDYQTGALVLETEGNGSKFLSNDGKYKSIDNNPVIIRYDDIIEDESHINNIIETVTNAYKNNKPILLNDADTLMPLTSYNYINNILSISFIETSLGTTRAYSFEINGNDYIIAKNIEEVANYKDFLKKDNASPFTPTDDYQPATKKYVDDHNSNYPGGILNIGVNSVSYDEDIINYGYLVIFLSGFGNIIIPIRISGDKISEYKTLISISDSVGVGESAYSLAQVTMSNLTKNANKYEGTINVAYLHRIIRESDYNDLGTAPETDDVLYFVIPD